MKAVKELLTTKYNSDVAIIPGGALQSYSHATSAGISHSKTSTENCMTNGFTVASFHQQRLGIVAPSGENTANGLKKLGGRSENHS